MAFQTRQLRSTITSDGILSIGLVSATLGDPFDDEVIVRIEATPINPSDQVLLFGPADISVVQKTDGESIVSFDVPEARLKGVRGRLDRSLGVGGEAAGTVVAAGRNARHLIGRLVSALGDGLYADYVTLPMADVMALPDGASASDGASLFINPMTALGLVETARSEGHSAIVHTAAASNLGQMMQKICDADGIPLVNVVRSASQVEVLRSIGAKHVVDSSTPDFQTKLRSAISETGATIAFDPVGGGELGSDILAAMESVAVDGMTEYSRYGSDVLKELVIYGSLDTAPTTLNRLAFGLRWSVSGWLLFHFLKRAHPDVVDRMRARITAEIGTTFASRYTRVISLLDALDPDVIEAYRRKATGEKMLIDPTRG